MLLEQTHYPVKGLNWGKIAIVSAISICAGLVIYAIMRKNQLKAKGQK